MSQKLSLDQTSVWRAKSKEFIRKRRVSEVTGLEGPGDVAEIELKLDLNM